MGRGVATTCVRTKCWNHVSKSRGEVGSRLLIACSLRLGNWDEDGGESVSYLLLGQLFAWFSFPSPGKALSGQKEVACTSRVCIRQYV